MAIEESTAQTRELGGELKRIRERARLSGHALARLLGWPAPKVSRLETGKRGVSEVDVAIFLARCGASAEELDRLMRLAQLPGGTYRAQGHGERIPDTLRSLIVLETTAEAISSYEPSVIPGLLQTETYTRELLRLCGCQSGAGFELRVEARLARQATFNRRWPARMTFFIHEYALRSIIGGSSLMYEQALHLVLASSWPRCEVRIVPAANAPVAVFPDSFHLLECDDWRPVVSVDTRTASMFLEDDTDVLAYRELLRELEAVALVKGESREWLASLASEHDRVEIDCDERAEQRRTDLA